MAAAVVYDGAGGGGTLFEGKKFWVAQRVPTRSRWLELIKANGGQIVLLERVADLLIADHARKDTPPGSYSWKWIEDSVKSGRLEDLENYRAGRVEGISRPVGSSQPARGTRVPFTAADDRALALWVTSAEKRGLATKGNDIYQQLEQINPRHTSQSWRDRWIKYVQFQMRPEVTSSPTGAGPVPEQPVTMQTEPLSNGSTARPHRSQASNTVPNSRALSQSVPPTIKPSKGNPFAEADRKALLDIYDDILNIDKTRLIEAWESFADENPQHTAQEWYKYWMEEVKPLRATKSKKLVNKQHKIQESKSEGGRSSQVQEVSVEDESVQPIPAGYSQRRAESSRNRLTEKEHFEYTLTEFAEGQHKEIDLQPSVCGRKIELFDLWTLVMSSGFNSDAEDDNDEMNTKWDQVATELGFDQSGEPGAPNELRELYEWILVDFADLRSDYSAYLKGLLDSGVELTEEQALYYEYLTSATYQEEDQAIRQQLQEDIDDNVEVFEIPSSPPQRIWPPSTKRKSPDLTISRQLKVTPNKRQRVDKGKEKVLEIPSTPEDMLKFHGKVHRIPAVKSQGLREEQDDEAETSEEDEESMFVKPSKRNIFSKTTLQATKAVHFEPETQDFHFSHEIEEDLGTQGSQKMLEEPLEAGGSVRAVAGSLHDDSSTQSQSDSQRDSQREATEIQELVDHYVSLGYPEEVVQQAMLATTLETGDVAIVMEALIKGDGIPDNIEGVWTAEDDRAVRLKEDSEEYARVVLKHKEARYVKRRQLLSDMEGLKDS